MVAEENQSSYSAQLVWLIAGGVLGILIVVMLLRRQMAARKKSLEDTWVAEAEAEGEGDYDVQSDAFKDLTRLLRQSVIGQLSISNPKHLNHLSRAKGQKPNEQ